MLNTPTFHKTFDRQSLEKNNFLINFDGFVKSKINLTS